MNQYRVDINIIEIKDGIETVIDSEKTRIVMAESFQRATPLVEHLVQQAWLTLRRRSFDFFGVETPRITNVETKEG